MSQLQPGIQEVPLHGLVDMTNEAYHRAPGISKSHLDAIANRSPMHYWERYINPHRDPEKVTPAKKLGTAIHTAILQPDLLDSTVVCGLEIARRSYADKEEWAAFETEHAGKIILPSEDYAKCICVRDAVWRHPMVKGLLTGGSAEQSFFATDPETGQLIKCRTDYMSHGGNIIIDVKSTDDASPIGFGKSAANYRYDVQPAWYFDVFTALYGEHPAHWAFLAFEKEPPYAIGVYYVTEEQVARARIAARRDFMRIVQCRREMHFPDYGFEIQELLLPPWLKR